jgi:hypothetical protein
MPNPLADLKVKLGIKDDKQDMPEKHSIGF